MPALFFDMIKLLPNTAAQQVYLSLSEGRQYFADTFTHYLFILTREENSIYGLDLAQVPAIVVDNQRYTQLSVTTVGLNSSGFYTYEVYGQNSAVNLDPLSANVVGLIERGTLTMASSSIFVNQTPITADDFRAGQ